ncbi:hypothetical protein [Geopseudomonas aromaticivorans]
MNLHDVVLENARDLARRGLLSTADLARIERHCHSARKPREANPPASRAA